MNARSRKGSSSLFSVAAFVGVVFSLIFGLYYLFKDGGSLVGTFSSAPSIEVSLEVARSESQRERGLMFRNVLPEHHGMIFVFDEMDEHTFWMKNTPLSLDIIHLDEAMKVVGVVENTTPFSETPITVASPSKFVIELKAGSARALGVIAGSHINFQPHSPIESFSE